MVLFWVMLGVVVLGIGYVAWLFYSINFKHYFRVMVLGMRCAYLLRRKDRALIASVNAQRKYNAALEKYNEFVGNV